MTPCSSSRHTRPTPAASLVEIHGERHPACNACIQALASNGVQGLILPLPDPPEPTMATAPTPHDDRPFRSTPLDRNGITPNRHLPHVLRPHADNHPELCRVADCTGKVKARGVCDQHLTMLGKANDTAILLPRADRAEAAKRSAATRAMGKGEPVVVAPVVEQAAPGIPLKDGDGVKAAPGTPKLLDRIGRDYYVNTDDQTISVWSSTDRPGTWCALDVSCPPLTRHPTREAAAAHLGAVLPDAPVCSKTEPTDASPYDEDLARQILEWRARGAVPTETVTVPVESLSQMRTACAGWMRMSDERGDQLRELQAQVEAQAEQIRRAEQARVVAEVNAASSDRALGDITAALDKSGKVNSPEQTTADRVRALIRYVGEVEKEGASYGTMCQQAHDALDAAGIPPGGQPADRIRILAERRADPLTPQIRGIVAEILAGMEEDATAGMECRPTDIKALRLAVGIEP